MIIINQLQLNSQKHSQVATPTPNSEAEIIFEGALSKPFSYPLEEGLEIYAGHPDLIHITHNRKPPTALGPIRKIRWHQLTNNNLILN